ncbi:hypothetical protein V8E52_000190 [Russula decolorans]
MADNLAHPHNRCQVVTIDHFPDDVLLAIFDFYVFKDQDLDIRELSGRDTKRKILLSATHLVKLWLLTIPHSGYISPEAMVTCLSMLTSLEELKLQFHSPQSSPDQESRPPVPPTRFVLPTLKTFSFKGVNEYLEELVAQIDTPRLDRLLTSFFNDIDFNTPELNQFINRTPTLGAYDEARLIFGSGGAQVRLCQFRPERSDHRMTEVNILCQVSDWQLSSLAQICTLSLQPFLTMENLYIHEDLDSPPNWMDDIKNAEWLNLLLPFTAVKNLYLSKPILPRIAPVLQELAGARTTEVLPALIKVVFEGSQPWEPVQEGIVQFISARRLIENPVASSAWDRNLVPDVPPSARQYISASATSMDHVVRDLNNHLQRNPHYLDDCGDLKHHFSYYPPPEGPKREPFDHSDNCEVKFTCTESESFVL